MLRRQAERTEVFNLLCSELLTSFYLKRLVGSWEALDWLMVFSLEGLKGGARAVSEAGWARDG